MDARFEHRTELNAVAERRPTVLAVGNFDGVHLGHQYLIRQMVASARALGARPAAMTFFPHPKRVIGGETGRYYLTHPNRRAALLAELGVELVITHVFNEQTRHTRAIEFVEQLVSYLDLRQLWGGNFSLGYKREGDFAFLKAAGEERGFSVHQLDDKQLLNNEIVSSSRIRASLHAGNLADANASLSRCFQINGEIVYGAQRGRTIGFPTANVLAWDEKLLPANGVYATRVTVDGQRYIAATNVGVRPTVSANEQVTIEAHLLDFAGNLYGKQATVEFVERIRPEMKFNGLAALKAQIAADVAATRATLTAE